MKLLNLLLGLVLLCVACSKNDTTPVAPEIPTEVSVDKIVLNDPVVEGDSIKLSWSALTSANFYAYVIMRRDYLEGAFTQVGDIIVDNNKTTAFDVNIPYSPEVSYQIIGQNYNAPSVLSNTVSYKTSGINLLDISPFDVIYRDEEQLLYFFEKSGRISLYDLNTDKIINQIETQATIGYADIESFEGRQELYVPRNDGWIFVYDALTLEKITQITVGLESTCVVSQNNILYVSTSAWTNRPLKVYQRADRKLIAETGDYDRTRFRKIPGSTTQLIEITLNVGPTGQYFYEFTKEGVPVKYATDIYHGDYPLDAGIFAFFPDGSKYITANTGSIYTIDLLYDKSLPRGNLLYTDFCFDNAGQSLFAATTGKSIEIYATANYDHMKSVKTKAYPYKIFKTDTGLLSVSRMSQTGTYDSNYYNPTNKILLEKIDL